MKLSRIKMYIFSLCRNGLTMVLFLILMLDTQAQNINRPNKEGPLGLQVNTLTGNLFFPRNDFTIPARGFNLDMAFYYNSFSQAEDVGFGNGWSFFYAIRYKRDTSGAKTIVWGDGREDRYDSAGSVYKAPRGFFALLSEYQQGKLLLTELDGTKFFFDNSAHKKMTRLEEPNGNFISFQYTDSLLTSISNNAGQSLSLAYSEGRLKTITDAITSPTRIFSYSYDVAGNLVEVKDPLNGKQVYTYLVNGPMKTAQDMNNNLVNIIYYSDFSVSEIVGCNKRISFSYDAASLMTVVTDHMVSGNNQVTKYEYNRQEGQYWLAALSGNCCGFNMKFEFDEQGNKVKEADANGNITVFTYDGKGNLLTITDALKQTESFTYSSNFNQVTSYTDKKGQLTTMTYDNKGNLLQIKEPGNKIFTAIYNANGDITTSTDPKGNTFNYNYDAYGNPVSVLGPNGYQAALSYNARGYLLSITDARGNKSNMEYDILGRFQKITDPLNSHLNIRYDAMGNLVGVTDPNGGAIAQSFDASNRLTGYTDAMGKKTSFTYDGMDNLKTYTTALGQTFKMAYDTRNRLSAFTDALGNHVAFSYEPNGNLKTVSLPNGQIVNYTYDALNRMTSFSDNSGAISNMTYDKDNNITSYTNGTGNTMNAEYDNQNQLVKLTDALGNSTSLAYDNNNNIVSVTDFNGNTRTYTYDGHNRLKTYTDNGGATITITYDNQGNITQLKDENNNVTSYAYDALNRNTIITYPDGRFIQLTYDKHSNVTAKRLTNGSSITYQYNSLDRLVKKTLPDGHIYTYTYDALGRVNSATNNAGTVTFTYDDLGRLTSETYDGRTVRYSYNTAGRTETTVYPDSTVVVNTYDTRGRLANVAKNNIVLVSNEYNNANQVMKKTFANGIATNYQYDFANRLINLSTGNGNVQNSVYTYNNKYHKTAINRLNNPALSEQFTYDNKDRLTQYKRGTIGSTPVLQNSYTYDALGNRVTDNSNGVNTTYTSNVLNQLTSLNGGSTVSFMYDDNGNRTYNGVYHKRYDAEGRLLKDSASPLNVLTYQYDALGRRVLKNINGQSFKYTYSGLAPIEERSGLTNSVLNRTIFSYYLQPVVNEKGNQPFYYHQNEMASVEAITNADGNLAERYVYDAYGKPTLYDASGNIIPSSAAGNRFMFTGQEYDSASNSYCFFFRNYSPETGTFDQPDLIGYQDGMGMYQYVHNNPANGIDILGLDDCDNTTTLDNVEYYNSWVNGLGDWAKRMAEWKEAYSRWKEFQKLLDLYKYRHDLVVMTEILEGQWMRSQADKFWNRSQKVTEQIDNFKFGNSENLGKAIKGLDYLGKGLGLLDFGIKASRAGDVLGAYSAGQADFAQASKASGNLIQSGLGFTGIGGLYNLADFTQEKLLTGRSMNDNAELAGQVWGENSVTSTTDEEVTSWHRENNTYQKWRKTRIKLELKQRRYQQTLTTRNPDCPQNGNNGGTQRPNLTGPGQTGTTEVISALDPNEIIGPEGYGINKWVAAKDRLPYTITYENDKSATAPAKFVRITAPIQPKMEATTFELGSFGFNSLTFSIPNGISSYYQRVDARDSLGLYIDVTAGYDQMNNRAFWEFQSIDPTTLLPPTDPLKGFLLLQDSLKREAGHGFVNFSIKPVANAVTNDTISAIASIVFDQNAAIKTNRHKNTIDAFAPVSSITGLPAITPDTEVPLQLTGTDDGSGIRSFAIYVSDNDGPVQLYVANFSRADTTFKGLPEHQYKFYVAATDNAGNTEELKLVGTVRISDGEEVICPNGNTTFESNITGTTYQWQVDNGSGFTNLSNGGIYSGTNTTALSLTNTPSSFYGYQYRCLVNGTTYSNVFVIKFAMTWEGTVDNAWENVANWSCNTLPDMNTDIIINGGKERYPQVNSNVSVRTLRTNNGASVRVKSGFNLTVVK